MVQAIINIKENTNRILNILKAKYGLKDKSQAIDIMAQQYEQELLEPELKPEYIEKAKKVEEITQDPHRYKNLRYPLNNWKRVHIDKHFVLTFSIDEKTKTVILEDYDHH